MNRFLFHFSVPFHEVDGAGVLFFSHLFSHAHDAYAALLRESGFSLKTVLEEGRYLIPLVHAEADYHHPLLLDDAIEVQVGVTRLGGSSMQFRHEFLHREQLCATAHTTHVFRLAEKGQATPIPARLRKALSDYCQ